MSSNVKVSTAIPIHDLWNARTILLDILQTRGYNVDEYAHVDIPTLESMSQKNEMDMLLTHTTLGTKMYVHHCFASYFSVKHVQDTTDDLYMYNHILGKDDTLLILTKEDPNRSVQQYLKRLWNTEQLYVVVMQWKRFAFNILKHQFVPPHEIMTDEEVEHIRIQYNITKEEQWPKLSRFDPVAQVIGLRPGQVCRILRPSKTAIRTYYYRMCV